jgi:polyisoprenoid-binding protein YceI
VLVGISELSTEETFMKRLIVLGLWTAGALLATPHLSSAETMSLKLLQNQSRATFKSDAPLETIIGNAAGAAIEGTLTVDPGKPMGAVGRVRVDMNAVHSGVEKRDSDMRGKNFLDTEAGDANRYVTFEIASVEVAGPLEPNKETPARVMGILSIKGKAVETVADARVTYVKLTPEQAEAQKRFGFTADNVKVRARFGTTFTDHGMQVPQILVFKVSNEIQLEADLTFVRVP